ncbi:MAG: serine hydrolase [Phycisphaerae bacterium]
MTSGTRTRLVGVLAGLGVMVACSGGCSSPGGGNAIHDRLAGRPDAFGEVLRDPAAFRVQVAVAKVEKTPDGRSTLRRMTWRCGAEYFYPASTVKLLGAVAALETLADLRASSGNPLVDADAPLRIAPLFPGDAAQELEPSNRDGGTITVQHEIRRIMLVSDNHAFNRLYDLVGVDDINERMHRAGLASVRVSHRLSDPRPVPDQSKTAAVTIRTALGDVEVPARAGRRAEAIGDRGVMVGEGMMTRGEVVKGPVDFSLRNRVSLLDLQDALIMIVRPDIDLGGRRFELTEGDRLRLTSPMEQYPRESPNPVLDDPHYTDEYCKFFLPGLRAWRPDRRLRVLNKVGQAYGFTIDNAYIEDPQSGDAFFLAACIYTNADGVLNDDRYEYGTIAEPFMARLASEMASMLFPDPSAERR